MDKQRFSMLLLEPGEIYFEDFSCQITYEKESYDGRLKLCSKSLVFEPKTWTKPLYKIQFKDCLDVSIKIDINTEEVILVKAKQHAEMLNENIVAPYKFVYSEKVFSFKFNFASAEDCLQQIRQLQRASTLHAAEHNSMVATISHSRYMRMVFDPVMMEDFSETILLELPAEKISPLVRNPGKVALTATTMYFQPYNNIESSHVLKLKLSKMRRIFQRRFLLRQVGLEIYSDDDSTFPHIYLAFHSAEERNSLYEMISQMPGVKLEKVKMEEKTLQWQNGIVSNYDYLLYLNSLADRSQNDLTQYPVFPWVLLDYTSDTIDLDDPTIYRDLTKPLGALNPDRLHKLQERFDEMTEPKFLYGSHYSAPGLVLFYLVRKYPRYMLCLQNGRFDHPDRMFNSVSDAFSNCLKNMSDFKELIPEFYDLELKGDFLINNHEIQFGERFNGTKVDNVTLPPWATSAKHFVATLREALESDIVSRNLHSWIDLIFGYKQRGPEARNAKNVFHHVCYEGSVDLECIYDMNDRHALEVQIMEFGQIPKQIFTVPHVRRVIHGNGKPLSTAANEEKAIGDWNKQRIKCSEIIQSHRDEITSILVSNDWVISVGKDSMLKVFSLKQHKQIRSIALGTMPLSSCVMVDTNTVIVGSWDNEIYVYNVEYGKLIESFRAHDDSVSCLIWYPQGGLLISGGWDCVVRVWAGIGKEGVGRQLRGLQVELDHDGKISAISIRHQQEASLVTGTSDGDVYVWNLKTKTLNYKISPHHSTITGVCFIPGGDRMVTTSEDGEFCVTDLVVKSSIYKKELQEAASCLSWYQANQLLLGGVRGGLYKWDVQSVMQTSDVQAHDDTVTCISFADGLLVTASKDLSMKIWRFAS